MRTVGSTEVKTPESQFPNEFGVWWPDKPFKAAFSENLGSRIWLFQAEKNKPVHKFEKMQSICVF